MAKRYEIDSNHPELLQNSQKQVNPAVQRSDSSPNRETNQSNVSFVEQKAEMNVQGMHIQVHNVAIQAENSGAKISSPTLINPSVESSSVVRKGDPRGEDGAVVPFLAQHSSEILLSQGEAKPAVVVERTAHADKGAAALKLEMVKIDSQDVAIQAVRGEAVVEGERKVLRQRLEMTDDGEVRVSQYMHTERVFYRQVIEILYIAALNEPEDPEEEKVKEKCIDCCCQAFSCGEAIKGLFTIRRNQQNQNTSSAIKKIEYMTPILRRGRSKGWVIHNQYIFPLVKNTFRNAWVTSEILLVVIALALSIASFSLGNNRVFNILHLILTIVGSILAVVDGLILLCECSCKCGRSDCGNNSDQGSNNAKPQAEENGEQSTDNHGKCKHCIENCKAIFDMGRMVLAELLFYPLLICDIIEVITGKAYQFSDAQNGIGFVLFVISLILVFLYVYVIRLTIVIIAIYHSQKKRSHPSEETPEKLDPTIKKSALYFQIYFAIHVFGQMIAQMLMIATIGIVIHDENNKNSESAISVSKSLWYMIICGYVLPVFGILSFFIVTYFWVQEFPIGVCVDFLSILQTPGIDEVVDVNKAKEEGGEKMSKINRFIHSAELKKQFKNLRNTAFLNKFGYPFGSPQMVILSIMYAGLQLGFVIAAGVTLDGRYAWFYVPAGIIGYIANIYVFTVAAFWSIVILSIIALIIFAIFMICLINCLLSSASRNNNTRRY